MVHLTLSPNLTSAIAFYNSLDSTPPSDHIPSDTPSIDHRSIHRISLALLATTSDDSRGKFRLSTLLKGCDIYHAPKPAKPEPTPEYKALMARLRAEAEEQEYMALTNKPYTYYGGDGGGEDEYTYQDLKSHLSIIANVLLSVVATSAAVWMVAGGWDVPERLALAFTSSLVVCVAEVVVFGGYLRRIDESRQMEKKRAGKEQKEVVNVWELGAGKGEKEGLRKRKV